MGNAIHGLEATEPEGHPSGPGDLDRVARSAGRAFLGYLTRTSTVDAFLARTYREAWG